MAQHRRQGREVQATVGAKSRGGTSRRRFAAKQLGRMGDALSCLRFVHLLLIVVLYPLSQAQTMPLQVS